jgi:hypothetical protein
MKRQGYALVMEMGRRNMVQFGESDHTTIAPFTTKKLSGDGSAVFLELYAVGFGAYLEFGIGSSQRIHCLLELLVLNCEISLETYL